MVIKKDDRVEKIINNNSSLEIENGILGSIMLDNDMIITVLEHVTSEMFEYDANSKIFKIMKYLYENKRVIDKNTVWAEIVRLGLDSTFLTKAHVDALGEGGGIYRASQKIVSSYCISLELMSGDGVYKDGLKKMQRDATSKMFSIEDAIESHYTEANRLSELLRGKGKDTHCLDIDLSNTFKDIDEKIIGKTCSGLTTGIYEVDKKINGLQAGRVYNFTGSPGTGKSIFALQASLENALKGKKVLYASAEMGVEELTLRAICYIESLNSWAIDDPKDFIDNYLIPKKIVDDFSEGVAWIKTKLESGRLKLKDLPFEIFRPKGGMTIDKIKIAIEKYIIQNKSLDLLVVDHTDLLHNHQNAHSDLYVIYKRLKDFAVDYNIPVLALHQFNRADLINSVDYRPSVFALKGGQAIHDNADVIMLLYRPCVFPNLIKQKPELKDVCQVMYAKRRGGKQRGDTDLKFNGIKFSDMLEIEE